jgi:sterol 24-C-methyltransferase
MKVLDVGCGIGGPAREICFFTDANIVGINNNIFQVDRAIKYSAKAGLSHKLTFEKGDFTKMAPQFGENTFDAVYAIEATVHAPECEAVYGEVFKVLKPGGIVSSLVISKMKKNTFLTLRILFPSVRLIRMVSN